MCLMQILKQLKQFWVILFQVKWTRTVLWVIRQDISCSLSPVWTSIHNSTLALAWNWQLNSISFLKRQRLTAQFASQWRKVNIDSRVNEHPSTWERSGIALIGQFHTSRFDFVPSLCYVEIFSTSIYGQQWIQSSDMITPRSTQKQHSCWWMWKRVEVLLKHWGRETQKDQDKDWGYKTGKCQVSTNRQSQIITDYYCKTKIL